MAYRISDEERLRRQLYGLFGIIHQEYLITYKLLYIYKWVEPVAGKETLAKIKQLRKNAYAGNNLAVIDKLYLQAEHIALLAAGRYAPQEAHAPIPSDEYVLGWRIE
jgi:hypothetical protein